MTHRSTKAKHQRLWRLGVLGLALLFLVVLVPNALSLVEGMRYLWQWTTFQQEPRQPVPVDGEWALVQELADADNAGRYEAIVGFLTRADAPYTLVPAEDAPTPNVLIRLGGPGPYTLFSAHYDKSRETVAYQGASDNTAAVAALLLATQDMMPLSSVGPVAILFTPGEETGMRGARGFQRWAEEHGVGVREAIVFDMIGRDRLAIRQTGWSGIRFWLPISGHMVYDGRSLGPAGQSVAPDSGLVARTRQVLGRDLVVYRRFVALTDAYVFASAGIPTVAISSSDMYYLDLVWERDSDRVELLDLGNLELARRFVVAYASTQAGR